MITSLRHRLRHGVCRSFARGDWEQLLGKDWPNTIMSVEVTDDFHAKQGRSTGRWIIEKNGRRLPVYLKRHYRLPWWNRILATLFPTRNWAPGVQEKKNLEWAKEQGFPVPEVVASAQYVGPWFRLQSMLAIEELKGMLPLHQAIPRAQQQMPARVFQQWKKALVQELARLSRELHCRHVYHKDLYLCHFYLPIQDIDHWLPAQRSLRGKLHMIDLHRLGHHRFTWPNWEIKDLAQLLYSSEQEGVTVRDRVRFWRVYRGGTVRTWRMRFWEWCIRIKWKRYRNHNLKRKRKTEQSNLTPSKEAA